MFRSWFPKHNPPFPVIGHPLTITTAVRKKKYQRSAHSSRLRKRLTFLNSTLWRSETHLFKRSHPHAHTQKHACQKKNYECTICIPKFGIQQSHQGAAWANEKKELSCWHVNSQSAWRAFLRGGPRVIEQKKNQCRMCGRGTVGAT